MRGGSTTKYRTHPLFARVSFSRLVTSLDCSPVRHAQIGIIDQAVHLSASVKTVCSTINICLPNLTRLYCQQAYQFHLQGAAVHTKTPLIPQSSLALNRTAHGFNF